MSKHGRRSMTVTAGPKIRQGEGFAIDVSVMGSGGELGVGIDLSKARVPDRRYAADVCALARVHGTVKMMFGQERVDGQGWRSLLVIEMSESSASQLVESMSEMKNPTLDEIAQAASLNAEELSAKASEPGHPNQAIALSANLALVAVSANEACIDFYHASPFAMGVARVARKLAVDPVVRVDLRSTLLLGLLISLRGLDLPRVPRMKLGVD